MAWGVSTGSILKAIMDAFPFDFIMPITSVLRKVTGREKGWRAREEFDAFYPGDV